MAFLNIKYVRQDVQHVDIQYLATFWEVIHLLEYRNASNTRPGAWGGRLLEDGRIFEGALI